MISIYVLYVVYDSLLYVYMLYALLLYVYMSKSLSVYVLFSSDTYIDELVTLLSSLVLAYI